MAHELGLEQARQRFRTALARRRGALVGTPLRDVYTGSYGEATVAQATTFWGARMQVVLPELVSCEIHAHGLIEPALTALLIEVANERSVVYDVGAHIGYYSVLARARGATVHAFEPSRDTLEVLLDNVPDDVVVAGMGLWSEETSLRFQDFGPRHSAVNTFLSPKDENLAEPELTYDVGVTTIDRYVERTGDVPTIVKIDAEGAELQVLQGGETTIRKTQPLITLEVGDTSSSRTSRGAVELALELGYVAYELTGGGLHPHVLGDAYGYGNLVMVPRSAPPPLPTGLSPL
ncbi:MAG: FkbM family methyltransferase [Actinomycetota bacterium]|nr:FkbM family methyltransferase [Actinomycetota bacterium]